MLDQIILSAKVRREYLMIVLMESCVMGSVLRVK